ncbi:MAG: hypothetical protein KF858_00170 [Candidatus Sumerlaeia bacterium]|nr:hypothetical protein [Candidatus Sumerlaeia bacterium]
MRPPIDDQEPDLPAGWTPEQDDQQWQGIARLLREADAPKLPPPAVFARMRKELRAEIDDERRALRDRHAAPARESFALWLRQLLLGGGPGAQVVRFAALAGLAFAVGAYWSGEPQAPANGTDMPPAYARVAQPVAPADNTSDLLIPVASASRFQTVNFDASRLPENPFESISRSGLDEGGRMREPVRAASLRQDPSPTAAWYVASHSSPTRREAQDLVVGEMLELVQQLRLWSLVEPDPVSLQTLRQLDDALARMLEMERPLPRPQIDSLTALGTADDLVAAGRHHEALDTYRALAAEPAAGFLAFVAQFQAARLLFDDMRDYDQALAAYRALLEGYPSHFLTDEQRRHVLQRIDMLTRNAQDNFRAVRLWQDAQALDGLRQTAAYLALVDAAPQSPLAAEAAVVLAQQIAQPRPRTEALSPEELAAEFQDALRQAGNSPHAAGFRYALAEVFLVGLLEPERAEAEYRELLAMPGSDLYQARAQTRLRQIERRR